MGRVNNSELFNRYSQLKPLKFLEDRYSPHWTVDQAREVIRIVFPKRLREINIRHSSYGIKHLFEKLSSYFGEVSGYKYCSNETIKEAMKLEGFEIHKHGRSPNHYYNLSEDDYQAVHRMESIIEHANRA